MRLDVKKACLLAAMFISLRGISQQLIQATLKLNANANEVEVWLRPNFSNSTQYLAQIAVPIAWPSGALAVQPADITVTLDPTFGANFGLNYAVQTYPLAINSCNTENFRVITLVRGGGGGSNPQTWTSGQEFKLLTVTFPAGTPNGKVKIADYPDGGSNSQGYYYTVDGNANYYISPISANNFYTTSGQSTVGNADCAGGGFVETNVTIPVACVLPSVSINSITNNSANVTWSAVTGASGYEYDITTSSTPPGIGTLTTATSFSPSGLAAATQYWVHVRTNCGGGSFSLWSSSSFTTAAAACNTPSTLTVSNELITSANISWNAIGGATGYEYFLSTSSTPPPTAPGTGTATAGTTYNATGLTGGTTYYIYVRTNCGSGNYSPWVSASFETQPPLCSPTSNPTIGTITTTSAGISWNAVSGSSGYEYVISTSSEMPGGAGTATTDISLTATALIPGTTYYVFVRNNCGGGLYSTWSGTSFNTSCPKPSSVTIPVATITSSSATITWTSTGASSYQYDISTSLTPTSLTPSTGGETTAQTSITANGLTPGMTYYAHIRSFCSSNNFSQWQTVEFTTVCPTPGPISVKDILPRTANISWEGMADVEEYEYVVTSNPDIPAFGTTIIFSNLSLSNLTPGTVYYVFVRSKCSSGVYSDWITKTFTTTYPPCIPLTSLTLVNVGNTVNINWAEINGSLGYQYAVTTSEIPPSSGAFVSTTSISIGGLSASTKYYVYVRTACNLGQFSGWVTQTFTTPCFKPLPFIIENITESGTANLGWKTQSRAIKYEYAILDYSSLPAGTLNFTKDSAIHVGNLKAGHKYFLHVRAYCTPSSISEWATLEFYTSGITILPVSPDNKVIRVTIYGSELGNKEIFIYDAAGKRIKIVKIVNTSVIIDLHGFASGIYFIGYGKRENYIKKWIIFK
jgi:hypothetical protein